MSCEDNIIFRGVDDLRTESGVRKEVTMDLGRNEICVAGAARAELTVNDNVTRLPRPFTSPLVAVIPAA